MKQYDIYSHIYSIFFLMVLITACGRKERTKIAEGNPLAYETVNQIWVQADKQVAHYVRNIIEDKNGGLWFGTNGFGVAHYDGDNLIYFSIDQGFQGGQITGIKKDRDNNLWFATDQGIVKYDWSTDKKGDKQFINYTDPKYFEGQRFWSVFADSQGNVWAGAARGIYKLPPTGQADNGTNWASFDLPYPEETETDNFITKRTTWGISEDGEGNIWFSTNGYGAFKYEPERQAGEGQSFSQYTKKDGLADNHVDDILTDSKGNIWFGTRYKGLSRWDGKTFTNYSQSNSIGNDEVCVVYEDKEGNVWFSSEGFGVYRLDPLMAYLPPSRKTFVNFSKDEGLGVKAVQAIYEDSKGRLWVGGGGGLYRLDKSTNRFINVTKEGPWE